MGVSTNSNNKVQQFGRIRYVEPNDFINEKYSDSNNIMESFNITHPQEDYSLSVDLEVIVPNRNGFMNSHDKHHTVQVAHKQINKDTVSFFSGSNNYLTDNPGSITYVDLINGNMEGVNESLGITNIYISYTSYFYPEVTINFTDIRGSALMMPNEEIYMRAATNKALGENRYDTNIENFFAAVFSFPSPEFKLRVKGFYGKKVEYSLMIEEFKSSFNNETGNFDAIIKFIGKMYGVYTDIPMAYLLIAPYCRYGSSDNNETIWQQKKFSIDGYPMPTFIQLKEQINRINTELYSNLAYDSTRSLIEKNQELNLLLEVKNAFLVLMQYANSNNDTSIIGGDNLIFIGKGSDDYKSIYQGTYIQDYINELYIKIEQYNLQYPNKQLPGLDGLKNRYIKFNELPIVYLEEDSVGTILVWANFNKNLPDNFFEYPEINKKIISKYKTVRDIEGVLISGEKLWGVLENRINEFQEQVTFLQDESNKLIEVSLTNMLGFSPSIKNIFMILMAHLEVFMELYSRLITNINSDEGRTLERYKLSFNDTDINTLLKDKEDIFVPPFPLVKDKTNEITYPSIRIMNNNKIEETYFIDSLLNGTFLFLNELDKIDDSIKQMTEKSARFIPTCLTDFCILENPYKYTFSGYSGTMYIDRLMTYLGYRCITNFLLRGGENIDNVKFGFCEAYNFWRQNINIQPDVLKEILSDRFNPQIFQQFLSNKHGNPYIKNELPCYMNNDKTKYLIGYTYDKQGNINNESIYASKIRRHPVCIEKDMNTFWDTIEKGDKTCTFSQDYREIIKDENPYCQIGEAPSKYIQLIDKKTIQSWNEELEKTDLTHLDIDSKTFLGDISKPGNSAFYNEQNIWYGKGYLDTNFKQYHTPGKSLRTEFGLQNINALYENDFEDGYTELKNEDGETTATTCTFKAELDGFQSNDDIPIFFRLTSIPEMERKAEVFLLSIPHNFTKYNVDCSERGGVFTMPYVTQLFLGMIMNHIINDSDEKLISFIDNTLFIYGQDLDESFMQTLCFLMRGDNDEYLEYYYKLNYSLDNEPGAYSDNRNRVHKCNDVYGNSLELNPPYCSNTQAREYIYECDGSSVWVSQINWFKFTMQHFREKFFKKDILGLINKYINWRDSEVAPGFRYLYQKYSLVENELYLRRDILLSTYEENSDVDALIYYGGTDSWKQEAANLGNPRNIWRNYQYATTGNTMLQRFCALPMNLFKGYTFNKISYYTGQNKDTRIELTADIMNSFYKEEYPTTDSRTEFTDRYACIHGIELSKDEKWEWYDYLYPKEFTDTFIDSFKSVQTKQRATKTKVYLSFNRKFEAYPHLVSLFTMYDKMVIPYRMLRGVTQKSNDKLYNGRNLHEVQHNINKNKPFMNNGDFVLIFQAFKEALKVLYKTDINSPDKINFAQLSSSLLSENTKLSMYRTLKNLYDKHLTDITSKIGQYQISKENSEFQRCHFIDTYYNDLGDKIKVNAEILTKLLSRITDGYKSESGMSFLTSNINVLEFMSSLCQEHGMLLLCTPFFNGSLSGAEGEDNLESMFTPLSYNDSLNMGTIKGPSYICFYPHQPSQHLDNKQCQYQNDGINIDDMNNTGIENEINSVFDNESKYMIPAFGVEYGSQKQSIFKNVNVNMDNPQVTEAAVAYQFDLINKSGDNPKAIQFEGQDLYKIYSNYSFTCQAEMMGCAQIQPLMYFQLNNIPMFRGVYQIVQVEHNIVPGNMTTSFKGVRINKNKIPMIKGGILFTNIDNIISNMSDYDKAIAGKNNLSNVAKDIPNVNINYTTDTMVSIPRDNDIHYDGLINTFGRYIHFRDVTSGINQDAKESFNNVNPELRRFFYGILQYITDNKKDMQVIVTSSTRDIAQTRTINCTSDHAIGSFENLGEEYKTNPSERRKQIMGRAYGSTTEVPYSELGCALDLDTNSKKTNVELFAVIAIQFTDYIRQLIWEHSPSYGDTDADNVIGNCIHLSSYGKRGTNGSDKTEIFVSNNASGKSIKADNIKNMSTYPTNIPLGFLETLYRIPADKFEGITLNNWTTKPTQEQIKNWIDALQKISV